MGNGLRRNIKIYGLGCNRTWFGWDSFEAYDNVELRLGCSYIELYYLGKIYAVVLPMLVEEPIIETSNINIFSPSTSFGGFELMIQFNKIIKVTLNEPTASHEYLGDYLSEFFNLGRPPVFAQFYNDTGGELDVPQWPEETETSWITIIKRPWQRVPVPGEILWWGREALQVTAIESHSLGSTDVTHRFKCIKRVLGTFHERRGDRNQRNVDIEIYSKNPMILSREVDVYDYEPDTDTMHFRGGGYMQEPEDLGSGKMHGVMIECTGRRGRINKQKYANSRAFWFQESNSDSTQAYSKLNRVIPVGQLPGPGLKTGSGADYVNLIVCKRGESVVLCEFKEDADALDVGVRKYSIEPIPFGALIGTIQEDEGGKVSGSRGALEELIIGLPEYSHFWFDFGGANHEYSSHPFDVIRAFLISTDGRRGTTYDVIPGNWGLGIPDEMFNHEEIDTLKGGVLGGPTWVYMNLSMELFVAGSDVEEEVWQLVDRLLKPLFCVRTIDAQGRITIKTALDLGPEHVVASYANTDFGQGLSKLKYKKTEYTPVRDIKYNISRRGVGGKYSGEIRATDLRGAVTNRFAGLAEDEVSSAVDYGLPGFVPNSWDGTSSTRSLLHLAAMRYFYRNSSIHHYRATLVDPVQRLDPLTLIVVEHPALINADGGNGFPSRRMMILSHSQDPPSKGALNRVHLVDVEDLSKNSKLIAPSYEIGPDVGGGPEELPVLSAEHAREGMVINLVDRNFRPYDLSETRTITDIDTSPSTISISSAFSTVPSEGDFLVLADYPVSDPAEIADYAWIANDEAELGTNPDEGATWGF